MAPGCGSNLFYKQQSSLDTVDSFEVLEQTVMKQKRLAKKKNSDLRMKILLKRTFDLVCEIMDRENGFDQLDDDSNAVVDQLMASSSDEAAVIAAAEELLLHANSDDLNLFDEQIDSCTSSSESSELLSLSNMNSSKLSITNTNLNEPHIYSSLYSSNTTMTMNDQLVPLPRDCESNQNNERESSLHDDSSSNCNKNSIVIVNLSQHNNNTKKQSNFDDFTQLKRKYEANKSNNLARKKLKLTTVDQNTSNSNSNSNSRKSTATTKSSHHHHHHHKKSKVKSYIKK